MGLIARGGMAEVYRARGRAMGSRLLAIKCMRPQLAKEARFVEMFVREGKLAVLLEHENIVRTYEIGRTEGRYFIAMEYIGGRDLTQILRRCQETNTRIPVPHACYIAAKICEGLHYAHTHTDSEGRPLSIVNRDVSPSNVRIGYDGEVKLLDFGIAQAMLKFTSEIGVLKGKFSYMSPEQIRGMPVDARTDVFSTGIVLHEMLTTEKLFRGDTDFQLMERVRKAEVLAPSKFNRRVPPELDRVVLKALARDVQDRYQTAAELRQDLYAVLEQYRFDPRELVEHVRSLFRGDYQRELEEISACQAVVLPQTDEGRPNSLILPASALASAIPSGGTGLAGGSPSGSHAAAQPVPREEETAPVSIPVSGSEELQVPATQTGVDGLEGTEATDTGNSTRPTAPSQPAKSGLWARLRGKFIR
ncbi:MAG: serine/threonine-protein kinase [Myxococcales bacterium]|nr:serine/threonine protein kinase [Myxococcota bacterium]MDW8283489.1 serine/threonine-protein kinase [Myxococcales bacterium]